MNARSWRLWKLILIGLLCLSACGSMLAQTESPAYRADRILVKPKPNVDLNLLHTQLGAQVRRTYPAIQNLQVVQLPPLADPLTFVTLYQRSGLVDYAEPDFKLYALRTPNDLHFGNGTLWGLHNTGQIGGVPDADIDAPEAWDVLTSAANVIVAVIDTGVRYTHEDLAVNMWVNSGETGRDFLGRDRRNNFWDDDGNGYLDDVHGINAILGTGMPWDDHGHGTHVSGTVGAAGNNGVGVVGVAWQARLMELKFLDALGQGSMSDAIECIDYARGNGARIISASWGGYGASSGLRDAIASARDAGMLFVAAAGNDASNNDSRPPYPASYELENIIAVAATTRRDELASFSNFGPTTVDLGAPGEDIFSTWNLTDSAYQYLSGTSMATPHVAGACALVWARYPAESHVQIKDRVLSGTDPLPALAGRCVTGGRLNLQMALGSSTPPPARPVVTVSASDANASESGDTGRFTVARTGSTAAALTVNYALGGTALEGEDYESPAAPAIIAVGATTVGIPVRPIDDSLREGDETVVLTLEADAAYTLGSPGAATVIIADNDSPPPPLFGGVLRPPLGGILLLERQSASGLTLDASPQFQLRLVGDPERTYILETSTNLTDWTAIATNRANAVGHVIFGAPPGADPAPRYFRGRLGPLGLLGGAYRPDRVLVKPRSGVTLADLSALNVTLGVSALEVFPALENLTIVEPPGNLTASTLVAMYRQSGLVEYAEHDYRVRALVTPNDVHFQDGSLWNFHNTGQQGGVPDADIDAPEAWDRITDAPNVIVAVIDTGVRYTHEDLAPNMWVNPGEIPGNGIDDDGNDLVDDVHGFNTLDGSGDPRDDHGHGTHVAGIVGALGDNELGVAGICWRVQIMALKFLDAQGDGSISDAIRCLDYARAKGAHVINASWGAPWFTSQALEDAFAGVRDAGIIVAAASGNANGDNNVDPLYPASYDLDNLIAVAATTRTDELAAYSNFGATKVHLAAPGSSILSCWNIDNGSYQFFDGTSTAAAHVSGVAALLRALYPDENHRQIIERILNSVDPLPTLAGRCATGGRLNARSAVGIGSPPPDTPTVTVTASEPDASEDGAAGTFTVSRTGDTATALTVDYTLDGTAEPGVDYESLPGWVTIAAGSVAAGITVTPIDDSDAEESETVILTLSARPEYAVGSPGSATVTIADNERVPSEDQPVLSLSVPSPDASEAGSVPGAIRLHRTGDLSQPIQVNWTFSGTADNGADFEELPTSSPFPDGSSEADLTIVPIDDDLVEGDETVIVTLAPGADYTIGAPDSGAVSIADNDDGPPPPPPLVADFTGSPLLGLVPLAVEFTDRSTGNPVSWHWDFGDGSSSSARHPTHVYLLPGDYTATLTVRSSAGAAASKSAVIRARLLL